MSVTTPAKQATMHWFRKGLRLHDNPALMSCLRHCQQQQQQQQQQKPSSSDKEGVVDDMPCYPVYVLDGDSYSLFRCTPLRANFLLECLQNLDDNLRQLGSRLYVIKGDPVVELPKFWKSHNITFMTFEEDETGEPYGQERDDTVRKLANQYKIKLESQKSETLYPLSSYLSKVGNSYEKLPNTMGSFQKLFQRMPPLTKPIPAPTKDDFSFATISNHDENKKDDNDDDEEHCFRVPTKLTDIPWPRSIPREEVTPLWTKDDCRKAKLTPIVRGGETLALQQLASSLQNASWVASFEKPKTSCTSSHRPSTTCLSPYISAGCLSPRQVWYAISNALARTSSPATKPPVSLHGQMLWRDFNHLMAHAANHETPGSWNKMVGNKYCRQIPWNDNNNNKNGAELLNKWKTGQTGYPWIDACMVQLQTEGWIHHLGRHAVACFLTRGDLWQSWEEGAQHFEATLLDADYALNGFNWMWLSCSGFFYQYFRCYSPVAFQKNNDPNGAYIRKYLPQLSKLPSKYIYEPWKAPIAVLKSAGIRLGVDYPSRPIVDHAVVSKENMAKMKLAYDNHKKNRIEEEGKADVSNNSAKRRQTTTDTIIGDDGKGTKKKNANKRLKQSKLKF